MSKHTPGPWYSRESSAGQALIASEANGKTVAVAYAPADGPALAAAPELLRALDAATCPVWVHNAAHTNNIEALRAIALWYADWNNNVRLPAIAKAEGQPDHA